MKPSDFDQLVRREFPRLTAQLLHGLGLAHIAVAEDALQTALLRAARLWPLQGWPDNPAGWLYRVAWRAAVDQLRHEAPLRPLDEAADWPDPRASAGERFAAELDDEELQLLFACCHPALPLASQVALALRLLTGLPLRTIAAGLLCGDAALAQRLARARQLLATQDLALPPPTELAARRAAVLATLYLMFNEGYQSAGQGPAVITKELCWEAIRLARALAAHPSSAAAEADALAALLLLHGARLDGRLDAMGDLVRLPEQSRGRWDRRMVEMGLRHLQQAARGQVLSSYHLQACIAAEHARAPSWEATDWAQVQHYYEALLALDGSSSARLGHAVALAHTEGPAAALARLDQDWPQMGEQPMPYAWAARAQWRQALGRLDQARADYAEALRRARHPAEQRQLQALLDACG
ncbi:RNA polymerase sigma factor [Paucibacter sp. XJ19-41]|uniref:RNA polymerase sigma factor n=1 Tax=Paucibacter sp. XJ19-41 TaxID=2927824 RepID=UPI00234B0351|nr:DUF6596 domain-containing protein [Paucibacter sp. XJ19-41]MDC6167022.1 sigma factor [Paucibacter sp. XJ19-41]